MLINCSKVLKNLKGEEFKLSGDEKLTLGDAIAEALASDTSGGKMKVYILAVKMSEGKDVEVDAADLVLIKKAVESCKSYGTANTIIFGQVLKELEK